MSTDLARWLPESVVYAVTLIVVVVLVLSRLAEGSKHIADLLGPPGRWLRRRHERNEMLRAQERKREFREVVNGERAVDYKAMQRRVDVLYGLFEESQEEIRKLKAVEQGHAINWDMTSAYLREDAQWHIVAGVKMAEMGIKLPRHRSYSQFCRDYKRGKGVIEEE